MQTSARYTSYKALIMTDKEGDERGRLTVREEALVRKLREEGPRKGLVLGQGKPPTKAPPPAKRRREEPIPQESVQRLETRLDRLEQLLIQAQNGKTPPEESHPHQETLEQ